MSRLLLCVFVVLCLLATVAAETLEKRRKKGSGEIVKVEPTRGMVLLKVYVKKKMTAELELRVTDRTAVTVIDGDGRSVLKAATVTELLRNEAFRVGSALKYRADGDGTATTITLGTAKKR